MARARHPNKEIERALRALERMGWRVVKARGRSAHAWGHVLCPETERDRCRNGIFCRNQVWSTPRDPTAHARALMRQAQGCLVRKESDNDRS
jgi:hypothetical protein